MKRIWSEDELHEHWSLSREEQALLARKTSRGQLGFALLLKAFELEARFPRDLHDLPIRPKNYNLPIHGELVASHVLASACLPSHSHLSLNGSCLLQGQIPYKIDPFFCVHRGPDEEQIIYG